jgi:oligopeptide/dipeptide ABC transporter ATP-binding protein
LRMLRVPATERLLRQYPHEFSGGMRQRVVSAISLSCSPEILIADEPTTALDVTIQAAYLALLREIQRKTKLAVLFITHDFGVVAKICDRVAVMYAGRIVETAPTRTLFEAPAHPYTEALLSSVPDLRRGSSRLLAIEGRPPSIFAIPAGCPFASRCQYVMDRCSQEYPPEVSLAEDHTVNCWRRA